MKRKTRRRWLWLSVAGAVLAAAAIVPLVVLADRSGTTFTATLYSDVIRFGADGVASLRVTIYDLSENELWSSGQVMGDFVDWDRTNARGERLANGYYMYLAQGWDAGNTLILNKAGKVVLLPGDQVQLASAPVGSASGIGDAGTDSGDDPVVSSKDVYGTLEDTGIFGTLGVGTASPGHPLQVTGSAGSTYIDFSGIRVGFSRPSANYIWAMSPGGYYCFGVNGTVPSLGTASLILHSTGNVTMPNGNVGIGTISPDGLLDVESTEAEIYVGPSGSKAVIDVNNEWFDLHYAGNNFMSVYTGTPDATLFLDYNGGVMIGSWDTPRGGLEIRRDIDNRELVLNEMDTGGVNRLWYECQATDWVAGVDDGWEGGGYYIRDETHARSALDISGDNGKVWVHYGLEVGGGLVVHDGLNVVSGTKKFIIDHPEDPSKVIAYAALEGPEAGTYIRGTAELVGGETVIHLPDNFGMTTEPNGLTVQLTPAGEWLQLYVVEKTTATIVVREAQGKSGSFDYLVQGIRIGYADFEVIRDRNAAVGQMPVGGAVSGAEPSPDEAPIDPGPKHD